MNSDSSVGFHLGRDDDNDDDEDQNEGRCGDIVRRRGNFNSQLALWAGVGVWESGGGVVGSAWCPLRNRNSDMCRIGRMRMGQH